MTHDPLSTPHAPMIPKLLGGLLAVAGVALLVKLRRARTDKHGRSAAQIERLRLFDGQ